MEEIIDNIKRPYNTLERHVTAVCRVKLLELGPLGRELLQMTTEIKERITLSEPANAEMHKAVKKMESEMGQILDGIKMNEMLQTPSAEMEALGQLKGLHRQSWQSIWVLVPVWVNTAVNGIFQNGCDMQRTRGTSDSMPHFTSREP